MKIDDIVYSKMQSEIAALASSINEIVGKFKKLQHPLTESREKVPKATEQLDKISEQTAQATNRMLDTVEEITQREEQVKQGLNTLKEKITSGNLNGVEELIDSLVEYTEQTNEDVYSIMDTLQFQDITAQQINHAASLLEEVEARLHKIVAVYNGQESSVVDEHTGSSKTNRAFDPHADFSDKKSTQADIDNLIAQKAKS